MSTNLFSTNVVNLYGIWAEECEIYYVYCLNLYFCILGCHGNGKISCSPNDFFS